MGKKLKITLITVVLLLICLLLFFSGHFLQKIEKKIVFKPSRQMQPLISEIKEEAEIKTFRAKNGLKLGYMHLNPGNGSLPKIIFCHGNDKNITAKKFQKKLLFLVQKGFEVFALDYRGYGNSEGIPDEAGVYSDLSEFVNYLEAELNIKPEKTVIWGHSLGAAIAVNEASRQNFLALIMEGGFTSIEDMRDFRIKHDDKGNFLSNFIRNLIYNSLKISQKFDSKEKIHLINSPMLIIHSKNDKVVPYQMSLQLSKLNPKAKVFIFEKGSHNSTGWQEEVILEFLETLPNS